MFGGSRETDLRGRPPAPISACRLSAVRPPCQRSLRIPEGSRGPIGLSWKFILLPESVPGFGNVGWA
eukprot:3638985-Pyramimonas_sp.AAC.1